MLTINVVIVINILTISRCHTSLTDPGWAELNNFTVTVTVISVFTMDTQQQRQVKVLREDFYYALNKSER